MQIDRAGVVHQQQVQPLPRSDQTKQTVRIILPPKASEERPRFDSLDIMPRPDGDEREVNECADESWEKAREKHGERDAGGQQDTAVVQWKEIKWA